MDDKTINALQLVSRFSLPPNSLGYCGVDTAPQKFSSCIINGLCNGVEEEVEKFIVLNPYLNTIAQITNKPKFSYDVIESYVLGNNLLDKVGDRHYELLMENFLKQGVPEWFVEELRNKKPKKFIPTHLFQVLHIGVGQVSGSVPYNMDSINNCMVRWGKVEKITDSIETVETGSVKVKLNSLKKVNGKFELTKTEEKMAFVKDFVPEIKQGSIVAVHWNQVTKILTKNETEKLLEWTEKTLDAVN